MIELLPEALLKLIARPKTSQKEAERFQPSAEYWP